MQKLQERTPCLQTTGLEFTLCACCARPRRRAGPSAGGDPLDGMHNPHPERIRLSGIDCPDKGQAFDNHTKHAASDLAFRIEVTIQTHGLDKYKRTLGDVILPDGMNLNQELVKEGWCWWYRKYAPGDTVLERLEAAAREARKGLWADPQPVPPWE